MNRQLRETAHVFASKGDELLGITHHGAVNARKGVVVIVGGPQYRVGSHRQFLLLARGLATRGIPVFRFDCRGMGDSSGVFPGFEFLNDDIHSAIDCFFGQTQGLEEVVIWGLCDGASAASFYADQDPRVSGMILVNPWIRTDKGEARAYLKHYYLTRLVNREFWQKVFSGKFQVKSSFQSLLEICRRLLSRPSIIHSDDKDKSNQKPGVDQSLPERFYQGIRAFKGEILLIISGNDLTAAEFLDVTGREKKWQKVINSPGFERECIAEADHTFSKEEWMSQVIDISYRWLNR